MTPQNESMNKLMTPEERELFESFRDRIGMEYVPTHEHELFYPLFNDGDVRATTIRKWAHINGDENPLWVDPEYAAAHRGGVTAPPLFLLTINDAVMTCAFFTSRVFTPAPTPVLNRERYPTIRGVMQLHTDWEFFLPVRPGDDITVTAELADIYWKPGRRHRLLFVFGLTTYHNQHKVRVAICEAGAVYMFQQKPVPGGGKS